MPRVPEASFACYFAPRTLTNLLGRDAVSACYKRMINSAPRVRARTRAEKKLPADVGVKYMKEDVDFGKLRESDTNARI